MLLTQNINRQYTEKACEGSIHVFQRLHHYAEFKNLIGERRKATFILFKNLHELSKPVPFETLSKKLGIQRMSRMGKYITQEEALGLI